MRRLVWTTAVLALAGSCLVLIPSAAATTTSGVKVMHLQAPVAALAMSGKRIALDVTSTPVNGRETPNQVLVWNLATGATTKVSGRQTAGADGTAVGGVTGLAIAGTRVAWRTTDGGNTETYDDIYASSSVAPKERHVAGVGRGGDQCGAGIAGPVPACAGTWLGGVVASGNKILINRWKTDVTGAITSGGLYTLRGKRTLVPFDIGSTAVEAVAADANRIAVQQWRWYDPDPTINVFSSSGEFQSTLTPAAQPRAVALSGRNLLVLLPRKIVLYDAQTGALKRTFALHHNWQAAAIAVHGNVAAYSTATVRGYNSVRAINLTTGKDSFIGRLPGQIQQLAMDSAGLAYANNVWSLKDGYVVQLVFRPLAQVAAAVK